MERKMPMANLCLSKLQAKLGEIEMKCVWFPGKTLKHLELMAFVKDVDSINAGPKRLDYGYFASDISEEARQDFLNKTIWCVVYLRNKPIGFIYNYYLGEIAGTSVIHLGLVKFRAGLGSDFIAMPYFPTTMGNLLNFGPYFATNVSHLPIILENFGELGNDVFPSPQLQDMQGKQDYENVRELLVQTYLEPILGYDRNKIDPTKSIVRGSLAECDQAFKTNWKVLPAAKNDQWTDFIKGRLTLVERADGHLHVEDDMIQIGKIDFASVGRTKAAEIFGALKIQQNFEFIERGSDKPAVAAPLPFIRSAS